MTAHRAVLAAAVLLTACAHYPTDNPPPPPPATTTPAIADLLLPQEPDHVACIRTPIGWMCSDGDPHPPVLR